jgi:hypothetical protein
MVGVMLYVSPGKGLPGGGAQHTHKQDVVHPGGGGECEERVPKQFPGTHAPRSLLAASTHRGGRGWGEGPHPLSLLPASDGWGDATQQHIPVAAKGRLDCVGDLVKREAGGKCDTPGDAAPVDLQEETGDGTEEGGLKGGRDGTESTCTAPGAPKPLLKTHAPSNHI